MHRGRRSIVVTSHHHNGQNGDVDDGDEERVYDETQDAQHYRPFCLVFGSDGDAQFNATVASVVADDATTRSTAVASIAVEHPFWKTARRAERRCFHCHCHCQNPFKPMTPPPSITFNEILQVVKVLKLRVVVLSVTPPFYSLTWSILLSFLLLSSLFFFSIWSETIKND